MERTQKYLFLRAEVKKKTFIDIHNRLEELEIVDKAEWLKLREIRNDIAHEYSFNTDEVVDSIVAIYKASEDLMSIYKTTGDFCKNRFKSLDLDDN